jgi:hypothetical protein
MIYNITKLQKYVKTIHDYLSKSFFFTKSQIQCDRREKKNTEHAIKQRLATRRFLVGVNNGWFCDSYANDIGYNQYSGRRLWKLPYTDDISDIDFSKSDPEPPRPLISEFPELLDNYLQSISGLDIARVWLFESLEGLCFDENQKVIGIDNEFLINLKKILNTAESYNVKVYFCLFDSWVVKYNRPRNLPESRIASYKIWNSTVTKIMKSIIEYPEGFINNALNPLVEQLKDHSAVYAIDMMNEPEGMFKFTKTVSESSMRDYIKSCSIAINHRLKTSVGCMRTKTAKSYSSLPIDFCDIHLYNKRARVERYVSSKYNNKSCIIGECGYPIDLGFFRRRNNEIRGNNEIKTAEKFLINSLQNGYSGCLVWDHDFTSEENKRILIDWLKEFVQTRNKRIE